jgi:ABC-type amino acid transport system permease subunit
MILTAGFNFHYYVADNLTAEADSLILGLSYSQRFKGFVVTLLLSVAFFLLAFFVGLPVVVIRPHKFALCFTLGSLCFMASFAMLRGELYL